MNKYNCIVVLGPTASGKTRLACQLAYALNGEIISADSRQVYKGLDLGTGKDLHEYVIQGKKIPYHLIDVQEANKQFYLHDFIFELKKVFDQLQSRQKMPVICGGTGLYLDALRKDFSLTQIKENPDLRAELEKLPKEELLAYLKKYPKERFQQVDLHSKKRIIRGIEIAEHLHKNTIDLKKAELPYNPYYIGISGDIELRKNKIRDRLQKRIKEGLIEEVEHLLNEGISHERLQFFGLEYKFISRYLLGEMTKEEMLNRLSTAIIQFAKRQMTWFRKMEKEGVKIHWVESTLNPKLFTDRLKLLF